MDKITITINTTNDAFSKDAGREVRRIVFDALFGKGVIKQKLYDRNGNCVGDVKIEGKAEGEE